MERRCHAQRVAAEDEAPVDEATARHAARHVAPMLAAASAGDDAGVAACVEAIFLETGVLVGPSDFNTHSGWGTDADAMWERVRTLPRGLPRPATRRFVEVLVREGVVRLAHLQPSVRRIMHAVEPVLPAQAGEPLALDAIVDALVECPDVQDVMGDDEALATAFRRALG